MSLENQVTDSSQNGIDTCLLLKTGSCGGCQILNIAGEVFRWQNRKPEDAAQIVGANYCPSGLKPDMSLVVNRNASSGMGQYPVEQTEFEGLNVDPKGRKLHRRY